jgi:hypothetical protein
MIKTKNALIDYLKFQHSVGVQFNVPIEFLFMNDRIFLKKLKLILLKELL